MYCYSITRAEFQFHNGLIKITRCKVEYGATIIFQFHNGLIKIDRCWTCRNIISNFNSTMVWLKCGKAKSPRSAFSSFQFHNGLIKITVPTLVGTAEKGFQFHNGLIKIAKQAELEGWDGNFNSTMVWLKCCFGTQRNNTPINISFHNGLIIIASKGQAFPLICLFHSTMVWLKCASIPAYQYFLISNSTMAD